MVANSDFAKGALPDGLAYDVVPDSVLIRFELSPVQRSSYRLLLLAWECDLFRVGVDAALR